MKPAPLAVMLSMLSLMCLDATVWADNHELEKQLNGDYADKVLTLRRCYEGDHLKFLSDGRLLGDATVGPWTVAGRVEVKEVRVKGDHLQIKGRRVQVEFDSKGTPLDELTMLDRLSGKQREELEKSLKHMVVEVEVELPSSNPSDADASAAMHAVFLMPGESMIDAVPTFWRAYFAKLEGRPFTPEIPSTVVSRPGAGKPGAVSAPRALYAPDPEYAEPARKAKFQGTEVLWLIVDPNGEPRDIQIQRPLGLGLDEKAVAAISTWRFEPARKDGVPVAVQINVEVSFRLY